jgi:hypothetical protein
MQSKKTWQELSEDEQKAKLEQISQAIKARDLREEVKIIEVRRVPHLLQELSCNLEYTFIRI